MPVRERSGEPEPKRCRRCHDSTHCTDSESDSWRLNLDEDLVRTLSGIFPNWFGGNSMGGGIVAGGGAPPPPPPPPPPPLPQQNHRHEQQPQQQQRVSPPKATVDASPLQQAMDKNKESLKVKLMLRRPLNQLVAQGIMPSLKTPPAYHEQRKQLERAKTGDLLKAKIQKRPDRQELERRHILEQQEGHVDPSLAEKQRMLKKARLADQLNDQLSHRPGPLELIKKNILHTDEPIERAVKEGLVPFKATCEGALRRPEHPNSYQSLEEDSPAEEGSPPLRIPIKPPNTLVVSSTPVTFHAVLPPTTISLAELCQNTLVPIATSPVSITSSTSTLSPLSSAASPPAPVTPRPVPSPLHQQVQQRSDAPGKDKNRKKSKCKATPKARTIKFHEYKGPPNANKSSSPPSGLSSNPSETSYELLLRQQQLFLQWQLEWQHKYPQRILPKHAHAVPSPAPSNGPDSPESSTSSVHPHQVPTPPPPPPPPSGRLEEMKVSDLKAELKRRNLPVSGPKPNLIERLRPFLSESSSPHVSDDSQDRLSSSVENINHIMQSPVTSPESQFEAMDIESQPPTPQSQTQFSVQQQAIDEDIVKEQARKIEELERKLHESKLQLQQIQAQAQGSRQDSSMQDTKANRKSLAIHNLQAKLQSHQLAQQLQELQALQGQSQNTAAAEKRQQEHREFQRRNSPGPNLPVPTPVTTVTAPVVPVTVAAPEPPRYVLSPKPELLQLITTQPGREPLKMQFTIKEGLNGLNGKKNVGLVLNGVKVVPITIFPSNPPPQYEEATRNKPPPPPPPPPPAPTLIAAPPPAEPSSDKSEIDDVLEILIKNGELPASAAQIPHSNSQDVLNHNTDFLDVNSSLHNDTIVENQNNRNVLMNQSDVHNNLQAMIHHNQMQSMDHSDLHSQFLNQNSSHNEIMNQNNLHSDLLSDSNLQKSYMNQSNLLHNDSNNQGSPHEHSSVLDELINANSMDSVQNMGEDIMDSNGDFAHLTDFSNSHMSQMKQSNVITSDHHGSFSPLTDRCDNSESHIFKPEMFSDDSMHQSLSHCDLNNKEHSQMDEGCNFEQLLGEDAQDVLDLKELGLDLDGLDSVDFEQNEYSTMNSQLPNGTEVMDMDDWLEGLYTHSTQQCDPLLGAPPMPVIRATSSARPPSHLSWDKVDFATT